ncbi:MAG: 30S ribosomal protein S1 [Thermotogaceae bacterium]|nr:30S ribosomal protein S1 [Thermotogaceae bacterium]
MEERREEISMEEVLKSVEMAGDSIGNVVKGIVVDKLEDGVLVNYGGKFVGYVSSRELIKPLDEYEKGNELELLLFRIDEDEGRAYLSEKRPLYRKALDRIKKVFESDERIVKGRIVGEVKGGYRVLIDGVVEAFLPGSQSAIRRGKKYPEKELEFEVINFETGRRRPNIVLSRKKVLDREKEEFFRKFKEGDIVAGEVFSVRNAGILVRLEGGAVGFLPRSEVSYSRVYSLDDMFEEGQKVQLKIIRMEPERKRVVLSLKATMPDPFKEYIKSHNVGDVVNGEVLRIRNDGFTMKLSEDVIGFVPIEEIFWGRRGRIGDVVRKGEQVEAEIVEIDEKKRRIILSFKKAKGDPWEKIEEKYPEGSIHGGRVVKVLQTGVIVEFEDGVSGFVPLSELSWNYFDKPEEIVRRGKRVKVEVLSIDKDNKRMRLSLRRAEENPWDRAEKELDKGSVVKGKVKKVVNSGYIIRVNDYNVDAYLPSSHVERELKEGDEIEAVVLRILNDRKMGKKMILSVKDLEEMKALMEYKKQIEGQQPSKSLGELLKKEESNG